MEDASHVIAHCPFPAGFASHREPSGHAVCARAVRRAGVHDMNALLAAAPVPAEGLYGAHAVREHSAAIMALAQAGRARHFTWHPERMAVVSAYVVNVIRQRHPNLQIPLHSCWRHFEAEGMDRWSQVAQDHGLMSSRLEHARARVDLAVITVLLDSAAGSAWHYQDAATGKALTRSEGLAVAALRWWASGGLSSDPHQPARVDAQALERVLTADLGLAFQVSSTNVLGGLEQRADRLRQLALALRARPGLFTRPDAPGLYRPGHLVDALIRMAPTGRVYAASVLALLQHAMGHLWPGRHELGGAPLGDGGPHPDAPDGWIPFHQLAQWMTYSLLEPLAEAGLTITDLDALTGLPDYRNGGLLLDLGVLQARDRSFHTRRWAVDAEPIVEWRALTVSVLDHLAEAVRGELGLSPEALPLARVMAGGSWVAGRQIAQAKRPGGTPPVQLEGDGTLY